jgi:hypothetical protein
VTKQLQKYDPESLLVLQIPSMTDLNLISTSGHQMHSFPFAFRDRQLGTEIQQQNKIKYACFV